MQQNKYRIIFHFHSMKPSEALHRTQHGKSALAYEQVLSRNFEIIESFLSKFHQIYSKLDNFDQALQMLQNRSEELQLNSLKMLKLQEKFETNNDMFEKKLSALKDFLTYEINSATKRDLSNSHISDKPSLQITAELSEQIKTVLESQNLQQKHLEQTFYERVHLLENNHVDVISRINRLSNLISLTDSKIKNQNNEVFDQKMIKLEERIEKQLKYLRRQVVEKYQILTEQNSKSASFFSSGIKALQVTCEETKQALMAKLEKQEFESFKNAVTVQIKKQNDELFGYYSIKKQTKQALVLFEKKLEKLELIENVLKERQEDDKTIAVIPATFSLKRRPFSIHSGKKFSKLDESKGELSRTLSKKFMKKNLHDIIEGSQNSV